MTLAEPEFDQYASDYEAALQEGLRYSGEDSEFFARRRVEWVRDRLRARGITVTNVLDFGCGTGSSAPLLLELPGAARVIGTDVSSGLVARARAEHGSDSIEFRQPGDEPVVGWADLAYCNGVFHHIPPADRAGALASVRDALRPGGIFALWENNPWNPGTRWIMSRIPFDSDAITLSPPETRGMLIGAGFEVLGVDSTFYFPNALSALRRFEPRLSRLPLGAQYMVLASRSC